MKRLRLLFAMPWVASASYARWIVALGFGGLLLAGLILAATVGAFAWEGWRDLRKRAHPFLVNPR